MEWIIYKHTNKVNGKVYIGQTKQTPTQRWRNGNGYKNNVYFYHSIQKYGVIEDSNKKAERFYSPSNVLRVYSSFDNNPEIFVRKEIYAPKLFIVRVRTVLLWRRWRDS